MLKQNNHEAVQINNEIVTIFWSYFVHLLTPHQNESFVLTFDKSVRSHSTSAAAERRTYASVFCVPSHNTSTTHDIHQQPLTQCFGCVRWRIRRTIIFTIKRLNIILVFYVLIVRWRMLYLICEFSLNFITKSNLFNPFIWVSQYKCFYFSSVLLCSIYITPSHISTKLKLKRQWILRVTFVEMVLLNVKRFTSNPHKGI